MIKAIQEIRLGEVLSLVDTSEPSNQLHEVNLAGVYSFGRGLFARGPMSPGDTSYKTYNRLKTDDFVVSQPKGWEGAIARVTPEFDGWYLSPVFPTFRVHPEKLLPKYLEWFCKRKIVWGELQRNSRGIGARRETVSPETFLNLIIPLPPLVQQHRIVSRIESLVADISEALKLSGNAYDEAEALLVSMAHRADMDVTVKHRIGWKKQALREIVRLVDDIHPVQVDAQYPNLGIYSFGRGLFHKPAIEGISTSAKTLRRVKRGQFIYSRLFAFEGAYGMVDEEFDGKFVSNEYPTFECDPDKTCAEFLISYFKPASIWKSVAVGSKGLGDRRQRVQPEQILSHELWLPPMSWQRRLVEVKAYVDDLKREKESVMLELEALVPSILDRAFKGELV